MLKRWIKSILSYLKNRPCPFDSCGRIGFLSCICGKSGGKKKETARQEDITRQERTRADERAAQVQQQENTLASQTKAQQEALAAQLRARQDELSNQYYQRIMGVLSPTSQERMTQQQLATVQPEVMQLLRELQTKTIAPPELGGPIGQQIQQRLLGDLAKPREIAFEDTFNPSFNLLREQVRNQAAQRGLVGSGLELENLGRAGIDLAVQQAQARMQNRQVNEQLRQQALMNAFSGQQEAVGERGQGEAFGAQRRGELEQFLQNLQALEDTRRGREISGTEAGAAGAADLAQTGNLTGAQLQQTGNITGADLQNQGILQALNQRSQANQNIFGLESGILNNQIQQRQASDQSKGRLLGALVQAALTAAGSLGGPVGATIGSQIGSQIGGAFGGGGGGGGGTGGYGGLPGYGQAGQYGAGPWGSIRGSGGQYYGTQLPTYGSPPSGSELRAYRYGSRASGPYYMGMFGGNR